MLNALDLFIVAFVTLFIYWLRIKPLRDFAAKIPGYNVIKSLRNSLSVINIHRDDMYTFGLNLSKAFKTNCKLWVGPYMVLIVKEPEDVKIVFNSEKCSDKTTFFYSVYFSYGLLVMNGEKYKLHRKSLLSLLYPSNLKAFLPITNAKTTSFMKKFDSKLSSKAADFSCHFMDFTLESSLATLYGVDIAENERMQFIHNMEKFQRIKIEILYKMWLRFKPIFKMTKLNKPFVELKSKIYEFVEGIMEPWEKKYEEEGDRPAMHEDLFFLDALYKFRSTMTKDEAINAIWVIIFAVYDTTAKSISIVLLMLAMNPAEQEKVLLEINSYVASDDTEIDNDCISKLEYLDLVIKESMRLIPVAMNLSRQTSGDVELSIESKTDIGIFLNSQLIKFIQAKYTVPSGTFLILPIMELHRDKSQWGDDADEFKPERFRTENMKHVHPYSYNPFSRGPRMCLGNRYALNTMKIFLSKFLKKYRVTTDLKYEELTFIFDLTTALKQGFTMNIEKR